MSESEPAHVPGVRPSGLMFEIRREDLVRGAGYDPRTFTGGRVLRVLSGGLHRASEIYLLVLDDSPAQSVVDLLTKPTRVLLEEQRFIAPRIHGPVLVYARQVAGGSSTFAENLRAAALQERPYTDDSLGPFSEDAFLRTDVALWTFHSRISDGSGVEVDALGLLFVSYASEYDAPRIASDFLDSVVAPMGATYGSIETFFTTRGLPENNIVIYRTKPRRVEPHEVSSVT